MGGLYFWLGASAEEADRAGAPAELSPQAVSSEAAHPLRIKPCPFCGKTPKRAWHFGWDYKSGWSTPTPMWGVDHHCAPGHRDTEAGAIADWNERA